MKILLCERINDANEYVQLLARAYEEAGHTVVLDVQNFLYSSYVPDVVHLQWPEAIYRWRHHLPLEEETLALIERRLAWYRSRGSVLVHTVHNMSPHEPVDAAFEERVYRTVRSHADVILHHGEASIGLVEDAVPECAEADHIVVPHGPYPAARLETGAARRAYGLPADRWVLLNFGRQRRNKGPRFIGRVFDELGWSDAHLFTIGPRSGGSGGLARRLLTRALARDPGMVRGTLRIARRRTTIHRRVPHSEIPRIMAASDIVFLGHQEGLNSGVLALAASYARPVLYPDIGNLREQVAGWPWGESYDAGDVGSAVAAAERLRARLDPHPPGALELDNTEWLNRNAWSRQVERVVEAVSDRAPDSP